MGAGKICQDVGISIFDGAEMIVGSRDLICEGDSLVEETRE